MTPDQKALQIAESKSNLTKEELEAYEKYELAGKPGLATSVMIGMYELFLNGMSCTEIARLNPNLPVGAVVKARVEGRWDKLRELHIAEMLEGVRERVQQIHMESIFFTSNLLSATHKRYGDKILKYLQTGDEKLLDGVPIASSLKTYKEMIELMLKLTGQDKGPTKTEVLHRHQVDAPVPNTSTGLSSQQAADILELIEKKKI